MIGQIKIIKPGTKAGVSLVIAVAIFCGESERAEAFQFDTPPDWQVRWDNRVSYMIGVRAHNVDDRIGNNPMLSESDYKFSDAGDIVTNKISNLTEFDVVYQDRMGFRASASMFKDFAYGSDRVKDNPDLVSAGASSGSYSSGRYGGYAKRNYVEGFRLLDAFAFTNFDLFDKPSSLRLGRTTQYWGNALFFGSQGINYGQNAADGIKGLSSPGTLAKELTVPRTQILFETALSPSVSIAAQYFGEYQTDYLTTGGTYLGGYGPLYQGPDSMFGTPRGHDYKPSRWGFKSDYGLKLSWHPQFVDGSFGFFLRQFTETKPWAPIMGSSDYHMSYADKVKLLGVSYETSIGPYSTGFELSYRKDTALLSSSTPSVSDPQGREGARGDTLHFLANTQVSLDKTAFYDTGFAQAEIAYTRLLKKTKNAQMYFGEDNSATCPAGTKWAGCATDDSVSVALYVAPQWLSVFPGVDIDVPLFAQYGLYGNSATVDAANAEGALIYSIGVHALINQKYNVTLQYNGYESRHKGIVTGPAGDYYAYSPGVGFLDDRDWVSLSFSTTF